MIQMALARRKRLLLALLVTFSLLLAGGIAWRVFRVSEMANIGSGYVAQQTCACLFVSGRSLESCMTDLKPQARRLISVHPGINEVTASGFGVATATARYEKGFGCSLRD